MTDPAEDEAEQRARVRGSALELASTALCAVEPDLSGDIADYDLEYALDVLGMLEALTTATREARRQLSEFIASKLEGVQYYRHRDQIIRVGRGGTWKVSNPEGLAGWLEFHRAWFLVNLSAQGAITKTRLEGFYSIPEEPDEQAQKILADARKKVVDTFMNREPSGGPITPLRLTDAPKKAQALEHGQSIAAKPRLEAGE